MLNGITSSIGSINPTSNLDSDNSQEGLQSSNAQQQGSGAGVGGGNLEKEIENVLLTLAQDLSQLASMLQGGQGQPSNGDGSSGTSGISSSGGGASGAQPQSLAAEPGAAQPGTGASPSPAGAASPAGVGSTDSASGAAPAGALGPNVPSALQPYVQDINNASKQTGVPASLIGAQILQESGGNPNAVTTNPALGLPDTGLMQVDQATFQGLQQQNPDLLGGKSVSDPATNIMAGALLDAQNLKQSNGDLGAALQAYNGSADPSYVNEVTAKMNALQNGTPVPGGFS